MNAGRSVATAPVGKSKRLGAGCCGKFEIVASAEDDLASDGPARNFLLLLRSFFGRASGASEFDLLQGGQVRGRKRLLSAAGRLYAVVAQQIGHDRGVFVGLERTRRHEWHRLRHHGAQLRSIEMRVTEARAGERGRRHALQVGAVANRTRLGIDLGALRYLLTGVNPEGLPPSPPAPPLTPASGNRPRPGIE